MEGKQQEGRKAEEIKEGKQQEGRKGRRNEGREVVRRKERQEK